MSVGAFVRLPQPLPVFETASTDVDAIINGIHASINATKLPDLDPAEGLGERLVPYFCKQMFDVGEVVWDDDAVEAMSRPDRAKIKADADVQYQQSMLRKQWSNHVIQELASAETGRLALRQALRWGLSEPKPLLTELLKNATHDDLQAISNAVPLDVGFPLAVFPIQAKLMLDPTYERVFFEEDVALETRACAVIAVHALNTFQDELSWMKVATRLLDGDRFAQFGRRFLERFKADKRLKQELLKTPATTSDWIEVSTQFNDVEFFPIYCDFVLQSSLADSKILAQLLASKHSERFETLVAMVDGLSQSDASKSRLKRFQNALKEVAEKTGKKVPKVKKKEAVEMLPAPPWPEAGEFQTPNFGDIESVVNEAKTAFEKAQLNSYFTTSTRVATALTPERCEDLAVGEPKFGGLPDLPDDLAWPEDKGLALNFVAQIPEPFTQSGTLFFFVQDEPELDSYGAKGAILFAPEGAHLNRRELPESYQKARKNTARAPYPTCRLHLQKVLQLAQPAHPTLKKMNADQKASYAEIYAQFDGPETSSLLGFRKCWDGDISDKDTLLLELTSHDHPSFTWGDMQTLSFFVPTKKLAELDFSKVHVRIGE